MRYLYVVLICVSLLVSITVSAQNSHFDYVCQSQGMTFQYDNASIFTIPFKQLQTALTAATNKQKNQLIATTNTISLWALKSNELQIHFNQSPETTKFIVAADDCLGSQPSNNSSVQGQAFAIVQVIGVGRAFAYAEVTASGEAYAATSNTGNGAALAFAQTSGDNSSSRTYVVQRGDNLFRIAINHGTSLTVLVELNNIEDPTAILVGQVIRLP